MNSLFKKLISSKTTARRAGAMILSICMLFTMMPNRIFAEDSMLEFGYTFKANITVGDNHEVETTFKITDLATDKANGTVYIGDSTNVAIDKSSSGIITIPSTVTHLGLTYDVTGIGDNAFYSCSSLSGNLIIPNTVTTIGSNSFNNCTSMFGNLTIPDSITYIGYSAFANCGFSGALTLSSNLNSMGFDPFANNNLLDSIFMKGIAAPSTSTALTAEAGGPNIYIPVGATGYEGAYWPAAKVFHMGLTTLETSATTPDTTSTLTSVFTTTGFDYTLTTTADSITVTPTANLDLTIQVNSDDVTSGSPYEILLNSGANTITIVVAAKADPSKSVTYTIVVNPVAYSVTVTDGTGGGNFSPDSSVSITANTAPSGKVFDKWTTTGNVTFTDAHSSTTTFNMPSTDVTAVATYKSVSTNGGGSSSGGGSPTIPPTLDKPSTPNQAEVNIKSTVDKNGNATVNITENSIADLIKAAEKIALTNGVKTNDVALVLNVSTDTKNVNNITVTFSKAIQDTIKSKQITNTILVIDNLNIQVNINLAAINEISSQAKSDVNLTATRMDNTRLIGKASALIGNRPVFDFKLVYDNDQIVQNFGTGQVSVALPYILRDNEIASNVKVIFIDDSGNVQWLADSVYDSNAKVLRFDTNHFGVYSIGYQTKTNDFVDTMYHLEKNDIEFVVNR